MPYRAAPFQPYRAAATAVEGFVEAEVVELVKGRHVPSRGQCQETSVRACDASKRPFEHVFATCVPYLRLRWT